MRTKLEFSIPNPIRFKKQLAIWANANDTVMVLDSHQNSMDTYANYDILVAVGHDDTSISSQHASNFFHYYENQKHDRDWWFGFLGYDLKNDFHQLSSHNFDGLDFPNMLFFNPLKVIYIKANTCTFEYKSLLSTEIRTDFEAIQRIEIRLNSFTAISLQPRLSKEAYIERVKGLQQHIQRGDIYEVNFCQEFFAENTNTDAFAIYQRLSERSEAPFSTFLKFQEFHVMCASPERFLQKKGNKLISQPIKGTAPRFSDPELDKASANQLKNSEKERAENVMIVDLVRNDLSVTAQKGSVKVEELCGIYAFKHVFQKISTISSLLRPNTSWLAILTSTFPMGSMTGAPKISAMQLAEKFEVTKRGLYSGSMGYIDPKGDFDFNVVIRSLLYNAKNQYLSCSVGSAITALSDAEQEYEECLLKAKAIREVLTQNSI